MNWNSVTLSIYKRFSLLDLNMTSYLLLFMRLDTGWFRGFIAEYGVPLMVLLWSALSYAVPGKVPDGVPRRLFCPLPWESASLYHWTVIKVLNFWWMTCLSSLFSMITCPPLPPRIRRLWNDFFMFYGCLESLMEHFLLIGDCSALSGVIVLGNLFPLHQWFRLLYSVEA